MASRFFEFQVPEGSSVEDLMQTARTRAGKAGITLEGDVREGTFHGAAEGRYVVEGRLVRLEVERKPSFVPWSLIESGLRRTFG